MYAGEQFDKIAGQYYLRARQYDPGAGRFTTADIFTGTPYNPLSQNRYTYCENNPIMYTDPLGLWKLVYSGSFVLMRADDKHDTLSGLAYQRYGDWSKWTVFGIDENIQIGQEVRITTEMDNKARGTSGKTCSSGKASGSSQRTSSSGILLSSDMTDFGVKSDTYKILQDLDKRWQTTKDRSKQEGFALIAQNARKLAHTGTPYKFGQNMVISELHKNVGIANKEMNDAYSFLNYIMNAFSNNSSFIETYKWFVNMTCNDWDYKFNDTWRVPYKTFNEVDMNKKQSDGSQAKNWTPWIYFDGTIMSADKFGNLNLGYIGYKMGFDGSMLINPATSGQGDAFWIQYGIDMAKQGR
jgi:RHS repeat-associated protein